MNEQSKQKRRKKRIIKQFEKRIWVCNKRVIGRGIEKRVEVSPKKSNIINIKINDSNYPLYLYFLHDDHASVKTTTLV